MEKSTSANSKKKMLVITVDDDYLGPKFYGEKDYHIRGKIDLDILEKYLQEEFEICRVKIFELDFSNKYSDFYVLYASSEERGLLYKSYIEDVLLKLLHDGAKLIPNFDLFRAHGNKVYQEMIRYSSDYVGLKKPNSYVIGKLEDLDLTKFNNYPYVVKSSTGSGSSGVKLARNEKELFLYVKSLSLVEYGDYYYDRRRDFFSCPLIWNLKVVLYRIIGKSQSLTCKRRRLYENKVVIQEFIPGLRSDFKVLFYYGKYYVLKRENRRKDFRASGSGLFSYPDDVSEIETVLDFAEKCAYSLKAPMLSMDIGKNDNSECYLIEFQALGFGPYTIQYSEWHFEKANGKWEKVVCSEEIEKEIARSIIEYVREEEK